MLKAEEILTKVNTFLDNIPYDRKPQSLYEPIKYVLSMGGKRIRPVLMLLAYNLFKDDPESILMPACALETYHNYTLLHDDLMDNSDLRRGHQTDPDAPPTIPPVAVDEDDNPLNFRIVEQLPEYPGGMAALVQWLTRNIIYPQEARKHNIQGRVVVSFIINADGSLSDIHLTKTAHFLLDREALRVAKLMPKWKPGIANNKPCRTLFAIPIEFKI